MSIYKILFLPHVGKGGGAGIYNDEFYKVIKDDCDVVGKYRYDYEVKKSSNYFDKFNNIKYVNYAGVSFFKKIFWLLMSFLNIFNIDVANIKGKIKKYDFIIYTSSIQLLVGFIMKIMGYKGKQIIIIQENLMLDGFLGLGSIFLLKKIDVVISITDDWSIYASKYGLNSIVVYNPFDVDVDVDVDVECYSDVLYVGGGGKIKGFDIICDFFEVAASEKKIKINLLGEYSLDDKNKIKKLNYKYNKYNGSEIICIGYVSSISKYCMKTLVIIIPITAPHFCRPAIEAGFLKKTYIVSGFKSLDDFAIDEYNCLKFKVGDVYDLYIKYKKLRFSENKRKELEHNNYDFVRDNFSHEIFKCKVRDFFK